jgi:hypothetical protein
MTIGSTARVVIEFAEGESAIDAEKLRNDVIRLLWRRT